MIYENLDQADEDDEMGENGKAKHRHPVEGECTNCSRCALVKGDDNKRRCTKCAWCLEDRAFDDEFARYLFP